MKLTPYVSTHTPPTIPGVYLTLREESTCPFWRAFDGTDWYYGTVAQTRLSPSYSSACREGKLYDRDLVNFNWCGLAEKPE